MTVAAAAVALLEPLQHLLREDVLEQQLAVDHLLADGGHVLAVLVQQVGVVPGCETRWPNAGPMPSDPMPAQCQVAQYMRDSPLGSGTEALLRGAWSFPGVPSRQGWCVSGATQAVVSCGASWGRGGVELYM